MDQHNLGAEQQLHHATVPATTAHTSPPHVYSIWPCCKPFSAAVLFRGQAKPMLACTGRIRFPVVCTRLHPTHAFQHPRLSISLCTMLALPAHLLWPMLLLVVAFWRGSCADATLLNLYPRPFHQVHPIVHPATKLPNPLLPVLCSDLPVCVCDPLCCTLCVLISTTRLNSALLAIDCSPTRCSPPDLPSQIWLSPLSASAYAVLLPLGCPCDSATPAVAVAVVIATCVGTLPVR